MFYKAIIKLYLLREKHIEDRETTKAIDTILHELTEGMSKVVDIIIEKEKKVKKFEN